MNNSTYNKNVYLEGKLGSLLTDISCLKDKFSPSSQHGFIRCEENVLNNIVDCINVVCSEIVY